VLTTPFKAGPKDLRKRLYTPCFTERCDADHKSANKKGGPKDALSPVDYVGARFSFCPTASADLRSGRPRAQEEPTRGLTSALAWGLG
jgi:hypothetical protein